MKDDYRRSIQLTSLLWLVFCRCFEKNCTSHCNVIYFQTIYILSSNFMSVNFMPGHLVHQFHVRHFQSTPFKDQQEPCWSEEGLKWTRRTTAMFWANAVHSLDAPHTSSLYILYTLHIHVFTQYSAMYRPQRCNICYKITNSNCK